MLVEIWWSKVERNEKTYRDTGTMHLPSISRPTKLESLQLPIGRVLVIGRRPRNREPAPPNNILRYDLEVDNFGESGISKNAVKIFHNNECWSMNSGQALGVAVQQWGSGTGDVVKVHSVDATPMSVRIDGKEDFFWVLLHPERGDEPVSAFEPVYDDDTSDDTFEPEYIFPDDSRAQRLLQIAEPALRSYYGQYLEWPPRLRPQPDSTVPPHFQNNPGMFKRVIRDLRSEAVKYGYGADTEHGREVQFLSWLIDTRNISFHDYRRGSNLRVEP